MGLRAFAGRVFGKQAALVLFLLCALPLTIFTALITPPSQSPDEVAHYGRTLGLLRGVLLSDKHQITDPLTGKPEWLTTIRVDAGLLSGSFGSVTRMGPDQRPVETQQDWSTIENLPRNHALLAVNLPNTATYFPAAYLPAFLGVVLAKYGFNATPLHCFLTARIFMALSYVAAGLGALAVAAYGEGLLLTVLLLPMPLFLGGTLNQDGLLTAMACLACAFLTRNTRAARLAGLVVFAIVLGAKPPYILLMGVFALPLFAPGFWRRFADMALVMLPVAAWTVVISLFVVVAYGKVQYHPGSLYAGDHSVMMDHANAALQWQILTERPRRFLALPYYSTLQFAYSDLVSLIGVLGPLQLQFEYGYYMWWSFALVCAILGVLVTRRPEILPPRVAGINFFAVMAAIGVTYWLLNIIFYLDWTNVGLPYIEGIQGRYLLILIPFLLFAIPNLQSLPGLRRWRFALPPLLPALPAVALGLYDLGFIPLKLVLNYYLH